MTVVVTICLSILALAVVLVLLRLILGPSVPDRVVALDMLAQIIVAGIALGLVVTRKDTYLAVLVAVSLLSFVGTVTVARFVERRGS